MAELAREMPKLRDQGVALHAITAEPGGADVLRRLDRRGVGALPYPVHSDPEHKLCALEAGDFYVVAKGHDPSSTHADYTGIRYDMVQPALLVVNQCGEVVQRWSWRSIEPKLRSMEGTERINVGGGSMLLVQARPRTADILPSIAEKRQVQLSASMSMGRVICAVLSEKAPCECAVQ